MAADGERNFLPIVAVVIVVLFVAAAAAGVVVWRRQQLADTEARGTSAPLPPAPPPTTTTAAATETASEPDPAIDSRSEPPPRKPSSTLATPPGADPSAIPNADRALARMRAGFRYCYNKGLVADPSLHGSITLAINVAPNGDITSVTKKSGGLSADVDECMIRKAKTATFDASPKGGTVNVPIQFVQN